MPGTSNSRQIGFQETDIVSIAKPITKKSIQLRKAEDIYSVLEDLYTCAQSCFIRFTNVLTEDKV